MARKLVPSQVEGGGRRTARVGARCAKGLALAAAALLLAQEPSCRQAARAESPASARRILPASAKAVDLCSWLGLAGRLVALPETALRYAAALHLAPEARALARLPRFRAFHLEAVLRLEPDLVVAGVTQAPEVVAALRAQGTRVLVLPALRTREDLAAALRALARAAGLRDVDLDHRLEAAARGLPRPQGPRPRVLPLSGFGTSLWTAGRGTLAALMLEAAGAVDLAAAAGLEGHAKLALERVLALDPEWLLVEEGPRGEVWRRHPGLAALRAVRLGRILRLPSWLRGSPSPYLYEGARRLATALAAGSRR